MEDGAPSVVRGASAALRDWSCFTAWGEAFMAAEMPRLKVQVSRERVTRLHAAAHPLAKAGGVSYLRPFTERVVQADTFFGRGSVDVRDEEAAAAAAGGTASTAAAAPYASRHLSFFAPLANTTAAVRAGVGDTRPLTDGMRPVLERNVWMALPGLWTTPAHYDGAHNAYVQVRGAKRFTLLPPGGWRTVGLYPRVHPSSRQAPASAWPADEAALAALGALTVTLRAGDLLHIPPFWFHRVEAVNDDGDGGGGGGGGGAAMSVSVHTESRHMDIVAGVRKFSLPAFGGLDHSQRVEMLRLYVQAVVRDLATLNQQQQPQQQQQQDEDEEEEVDASGEAITRPAAAAAAATAPAHEAQLDAEAAAARFVRELQQKRFAHLADDVGVRGLSAALAASAARFEQLTERLAPLPADHPIAKVVRGRVAAFTRWCRGQIWIEQGAWEIVLGDHVEDVAAALLGPLSVDAFLRFLAGELRLRPEGSGSGGGGGGGEVEGVSGGALGKGVRLLEFREAEGEGGAPGAVPAPGDTVSIHYTAWLADGRTGRKLLEAPFDTSRAGGEGEGGGGPFSFRVGSMQVIPGLERAVRELAPRQRAVVFIPAAQAYGSKGAGDGGVVPPYADLIFDIELLAVQQRVPT